MKFKCKVFVVLVVLLTLLLPSMKVFAIEGQPEFRLYPASGWIKHNEEFTLDVLVDTKGEEVVLARAAITFDPTLIQVQAAERNDDIFCDWPEDEQLIDNTKGLVVATGFCQSGNDDLYATVGGGDIFVRITFLSLQESPLTIDWDYTGRDEPMKTALLTDGSPPQNILGVKPAAGEYVISLTEPTGQDAIVGPTTPDTGVFDDARATVLIVSGMFLLAFGANLLFDPKRRYFNRSRTVVVYENKD
jgi:hypothetical protein